MFASRPLTILTDAMIALAQGTPGAAIVAARARCGCYTTYRVAGPGTTVPGEVVVTPQEVARFTRSEVRDVAYERGSHVK